MYAQVVRIQIKPGEMDQAISIFRDSVAPAVSQRNGFKNLYLAVDREGNSAVAFGLWETQADVEALASSGFYQEQVAKFAAVFAAPPERVVYEVAVQA